MMLFAKPYTWHLLYGEELGIEMDHLWDKYALKVAGEGEHAVREGGGRRKHNP